MINQACGGKKGARVWTSLFHSWHNYLKVFQHTVLQCAPLSPYLNDIPSPPSLWCPIFHPAVSNNYKHVTLLIKLKPTIIVHEWMNIWNRRQGWGLNPWSLVYETNALPLGHPAFELSAIPAFKLSATPAFNFLRKKLLTWNGQYLWRRAGFKNMKGESLCILNMCI